MSRAITEGAVTIQSTGDNEVFYNKAQVFNRDLTMLVNHVYGTIRKEESDALAKKRAGREGSGGAEAGGAVGKFEGLEVLECLSATGLRALRYAVELDVVKHVTANDLDPVAVSHIRSNMKANGVDDSRMTAENMDACALMYVKKSQGKQYDVIDVDPYGSCSPFIDAAIQAAVNGGLLCVTSTDMPVLGGNHPEVGFYKYGGTPLKARYCHEMAVRLLMNALNASAAKYKRVCVPLACLSIDFYCRLFVRVLDSPADTKLTAYNTGLVYQCCQCDLFHLVPMGGLAEKEKQTRKPAHSAADSTAEPTGEAAEASGEPQPAPSGSSAPAPRHYGSELGLSHEALREKVKHSTDLKFKVAQLPVEVGSCCTECGGKYWVGGPLYRGPLYDQDFLKRCIDAVDGQVLPAVTTYTKIGAMLRTAQEELNDVALFVNFSSLFSHFKLQQPSLKQFRAALVHLGFRVSHFHRDPQAIKTDAPITVVYDLVREWARRHPPKEPSKYPSLCKPIQVPGVVAAFDLDPSTYKTASSGPRFLPNPEPHWGPKPRAGTKTKRKQAEPGEVEDEGMDDGSISVKKICPASNEDASQP